MQEANPPQNRLTESQYQAIRGALTAFNRMANLVHTELISSCLVENCIKNNPKLTPSEALKKILMECVDELGKSSSEYKDIIVGRYFEDFTVAEMRNKGRPRPLLADRTFKKLQKEAIVELGYIFFEKENKCRLDDTSSKKVVLWIAKYWKTMLISSLLIGLLSILPNILNPSAKLAATNTPPGTISPKPNTSVQIQGSLMPTVVKSSICGENNTIDDVPNGDRFMPSQGVSTFTKENTPGGIGFNQIRKVKGTSSGVFISYYDVSLRETSGLSFFDRSRNHPQWVHCNFGVSHPILINSILIEDDNRFWIATDGDGIFFFDGNKWNSYTVSSSNIPSNAVFELTKDIDGSLWAGTSDGIAKFEEDNWRTIFDGELFQNQVSSLAFDSVGNIWVGHISSGISLFDNRDGKWKWINMENGEIGSNNVRGIIVRKSNVTSEEIWIITDGGGVDVYENNSWSHFGLADGLPSLHVNEINLDPLGRIWVATDSGVAYYDEVRWVTYNTLPSRSIDFSPGCLENNCLEDSHVWTGTEAHGLTHSRLPYPKEALAVNRICFVVMEKDVVCPSLNETFDPHIVTATLPFPISPGESFYFEVHVTPINGYKLVLNNTRGDFLSFVGEDETNLFGAYKLIAVEGEVQTGQTFIFSNRQNMFVAPDSALGREEKTYSSSWRVWMYTRYVGPEIKIEFTVRPPDQ